MVGNPILVRMISSSIDKTISEIKDNPQTGIKNLALLGNRFTNKSLEADLVKSLQTMISNPSSPYYQLLVALVGQVNPQTLKGFILNIAYNSLSYGAKKIKYNKKIAPIKIPWVLAFDFINPHTKLDQGKVRQLIEQGKQLGIYTYLFFIHQLDDCSYILQNNPDCAFILYLPPENIHKESIAQLASYTHTFYWVLSPPKAHIKTYENALKLLYDYRCLFGTYTYYPDDNLESILNGQWLDALVESKSFFGCLIQSPKCSLDKAALIKAYVNDSRTNPQQPIFLIDLYKDISAINDQLFGQPYPLKTINKASIGKMSLLEFLAAPL